LAHFRLPFSFLNTIIIAGKNHHNLIYYDHNILKLSKFCTGKTFKMAGFVSSMQLVVKIGSAIALKAASDYNETDVVR
jgi:hypothetical protein